MIVCPQVVSMVHGMKEVYSHIMNRLGKDGRPNSMAIRDDYNFWAKHDERYTASQIERNAATRKRQEERGKPNYC
jgi:hypothetical protein